MSQVEWPEVIDAQSDLKVFFCSVVFWDEDSGAVDQAVQWQVAFLESISEVADRAASKQRGGGLIHNARCRRRHRTGHAILMDLGKREERSPEGGQVDLHAVYFGLGRGLLF